MGSTRLVAIRNRILHRRQIVVLSAGTNFLKRRAIVEGLMDRLLANENHPIGLIRIERDRSDELRHKLGGNTLDRSPASVIAAALDKLEISQ